MFGGGKKSLCVLTWDQYYWSSCSSKQTWKPNKHKRSIELCTKLLHYCFLHCHYHHHYPHHELSVQSWKFQMKILQLILNSHTFSVVSNFFFTKLVPLHQSWVIGITRENNKTRAKNDQSCSNLISFFSADLVLMNVLNCNYAQFCQLFPIA